MAIQLPNPGLGDGQTGDNEFVMWTKVKDNFSDNTNAAGRLIGLDPERIALNKDLYEAQYSRRAVLKTLVSADDFGFGYHLAFNTVTESPIFGSYFNIHTIAGYGQSKHQLAMPHSVSQPNRLFLRGVNGTGDAIYTEWAEFYSNKNTTKDAGTGFLKVSSPVLHVYNDKIDKIHEAKQLDITVDKKGAGHYEIHGTTGLRQNDGWNMSPPRDIHGNVRCMIEVTEKDGVITVKTYKRKFDLELAAIVHDYDNPLDIPDGACVELRFNDLPVEMPDDTQTEV